MASEQPAEKKARREVVQGLPIVTLIERSNLEAVLGPVFAGIAVRVEEEKGQEKEQEDDEDMDE